MELDELNVMLADLTDEGALDSTGVFTLSLEKASEKLAAYRLANPGLFILNLVASAVSGGATRFSVETYDTHTVFLYDGIELQGQEMERIFSYILDPSAPAHLRELALALHGARALPGSPAVSLSQSDGQSSQELVLHGDQVELRQGVPHAAGLSFRLTYQGRTGWAGLFSLKGRHGSSDILQHLFHFCRYAPLALSNNGQSKGTRITMSVYDPSVFAWRYLQGQRPLKVVSAERRPDLRISAKTQSPLASSLLVGLGTPKAVKTEGLLLISRGVAFRRPAEVLGFPLAIAVVNADHLEKNLSQSDLVEGPEFHALIAALRQEIEELILEVCASPPAWSPDVGSTFIRALSVRYPENSDHCPLVVETFRRSRAIEEKSKTLESQAEQMEFWRSLAVGAPDQAKRFRSDLAPAVKRQANRRLGQAQWADAAAYLGDLAELESLPNKMLLGAVLVLAGESDKARMVFGEDAKACPPALRFLLGWAEEMPGNRPIVEFLRFQRAVETGRVETAAGLASVLEGYHGTAFLYLWLGWFHHSQGRYGKAAALWEKALGQVRVEERERWSDILWPELAGKVGFLEQVRWQAKRSLEEIQMSISSGKERAFQGSQTTHPARWAKGFWKAIERGENEAARTLFLQSYLAAMVNPVELSLEPVESPHISLSPFRG